MTQEDKNLLLKDLCARLPYGVKCKYYNVYENCYEEGTILGFERKEYIVIDGECANIEEVKPYLFPLSSMTEEQEKELRQMDAFVSTFGQICFSTYDDYGHELIPTYEDSIRITDWLLKNHFDYRGLIEKGLAIDATGLNVY